MELTPPQEEESYYLARIEKCQTHSRANGDDCISYTPAMCVSRTLGLCSRFKFSTHVVEEGIGNSPQLSPYSHTRAI